MAINSIIVDSSVWISYFDEDDSQHQKAQDTLGSLSKSLLVPEYVLLEVVTVLRQKKREYELQEFTKTATREGVYVPANRLGLLVASNYADAKFKKLSFVDVSLVLLSKNYQIITFDCALQKAINKHA